jgi:gamma-tubulin complex component 3
MLFNLARYFTNRSSIGKGHVTEHLLLRDTLYLLQGISGKYVKFSLEDEVYSPNRLIFLEDQVRAL